MYPESLLRAYAQEEVTNPIEYELFLDGLDNAVVFLEENVRNITAGDLEIILSTRGLIGHLLRIEAKYGTLEARFLRKPFKWLLH